MNIRKILLVVCTAVPSLYGMEDSNKQLDPLEYSYVGPKNEQYAYVLQSVESNSEYYIVRKTKKNEQPKIKFKGEFKVPTSDICILDKAFLYPLCSLNAINALPPVVRTSAKLSLADTNASQYIHILPRYQEPSWVFLRSSDGKALICLTILATSGFILYKICQLKKGSQKKDSVKKL